MLKQWVVLWITIVKVSISIDIWLRKDNIFVPNSTYYMFKTLLQQQQQRLIPCDIYFEHMITNSLATTNQYFDYFTYMSEGDQICYQQAIRNGSYLFPCPFLFNNNSKTRIPSYNDPVYENKTKITEINNASFIFVVDNTPFPFPQGSFSYTNISISLTNYIKVELNSVYQTLGIRLIYINLTIIVIYAFTLFVLIFKNNKTQQKMKNHQNAQKSERESLKSKLREDEDSDIDNYQVIVHNQFSIRNSKDVPSMISSGHDNIQKSSNKSK